MESVRLLCDYGLIAHADHSRSGQVNRPNLAIDVQVFSADGAQAAIYAVQCAAVVGADGSSLPSSTTLDSEPMATPKQLRRLATHPQDLIRYQRTGKLPQGVKPQSPLLTLLDQIGGRDRAAFRGLVVDERLGYAGRRNFHNAEQAMLWLRPQPEMFDNWPAESWRIKAFTKVLHLEDLLECISNVPDSVLERLRHLRRPSSPRPPRP